MNKEIAFAKELQELVTLGKSQGNHLSEEQLKAQFQLMELKESQLDLIREYLKQNKIGVDETVNLDDYLTKEDVQYLDLYLEELEELQEFSREEQVECIKMAMKGDLTCREQLIIMYLSKVTEIAKLYAGQGVFLEDLIGEGNVALTLAVRMVEVAEDEKEAESILVKSIMDAMEKIVSESEKSDEEDKKIVNRINKIEEISKELAEEIGRKVTVDELVLETEYTLDEILKAIDVTAQKFQYIEVEKNECE